tara:strand:- start:2691 stop:3200 length:510 start_codon:yes stop_codon:yes gene_type:complete
MAIGNLNLSDFKNTVGRGTRPNRYTVDMSIPTSGRLLTAEVSALSLPDSNLPSIQIPFRGRILKLPGDRRYSAWTFTVYDTNDGLWNDLHAWSNAINNHATNETPYNFADHNVNWTVNHYDLNGDNILKKVMLHSCWPTIISPFELQYGAMDQLSQFSCTVEYEFFTII